MQISQDINGLRGRSFLLKVTPVLQLHGKEYKETLNSALTNFQAHSVLARNQVLQEIRESVGNNVTTHDLKQKLHPMVACLNSLQGNNDLRNGVATLTSRNTKYMILLRET